MQRTSTSSPAKKPIVSGDFLDAIPDMKCNAIRLPFFQQQLQRIYREVKELNRSEEESKKLEKRRKEVEALGKKIQPDTGLTIVPCAGLDLHNIAWLFPQSDLLLIDLKPFGKVWPFLEKLSNHTPGKDYNDEISILQDLSKADGVGYVYLNKLMSILNAKEIMGVYFFDLTKEGNILFQEPSQIEDSSLAAKHSLIIYKNSNNNTKKLWYLDQNLLSKEAEATELEKFYNLCNLLKGRVGNIFIKAVCMSIREDIPFEKLLDIPAKRYISDAEEEKHVWFEFFLKNQIKGYISDSGGKNRLPARFVRDKTNIISISDVISLDIYEEGESQNKEFCYKNMFFISSQIISVKQDLLNNRPYFDEEKNKILSEWKTDPKYLELAIAFGKNTIGNKLEHLKEKKFEDFSSSSAMVDFFKEQKLYLKVFFDNKKFFYGMSIQKASEYHPVNPADSRCCLCCCRSSKRYYPQTPLVNKRHFSKKKPVEIMQRLGIEESTYRQLFKKDSDFWKSKHSMIKVYENLQALQFCKSRVATSTSAQAIPATYSLTTPTAPATSHTATIIPLTIQTVPTSSSTLQQQNQQQNQVLHQVNEASLLSKNPNTLLIHRKKGSSPSQQKLQEEQQQRIEEQKTAGLKKTN